MRDSEHCDRGILSLVTPNAREASPNVRQIGPPTTQDGGAPIDLPAFAAQLVEAAYKACHGDLKAARANIAHAAALLERRPSSAPVSETPAVATDEREIPSPRLLTWQARRLVEHIDANLAQRILVEELAELFGLSKAHFSRIFKQTFQISPHTYLLRRRVEAAQGLMLTTYETLSSIALSCGLCDQAHLTRCFQRFVGETPHSWRCARRGALDDLGVELSRRA